MSLTTVETAAVSEAVREACRTDYFTHCNVHPVDSENLRGCMKAVGIKLSPRCLYALIKAGEVSKSDMRRALLAKP